MQLNELHAFCVYRVHGFYAFAIGLFSLICSTFAATVPIMLPESFINSPSIQRLYPIPQSLKKHTIPQKMYISRFLFLKNITKQGILDKLFGRDGLFHYLCFQKTIRFNLSFLCNICENRGGLG